MKKPVKINQKQLRKLISEAIEAIPFGKAAETFEKLYGQPEINESEQKKIELLFSDNDFGTDEFGFIPRRADSDEEDMQYVKHVKSQYDGDVRVANGYLFLTPRQPEVNESSDDTSEMTEDQLQDDLFNALSDFYGNEPIGLETFEQAGIMTNNKGVVIRFGDQEFQITIVGR